MFLALVNSRRLESLDSGKLYGNTMKTDLEMLQDAHRVQRTTEGRLYPHLITTTQEQMECSAQSKKKFTSLHSATPPHARLAPGQGVSLPPLRAERGEDVVLLRKDDKKCFLEHIQGSGLVSSWALGDLHLPTDPALASLVFGPTGTSLVAWTAEKVEKKPAFVYDDTEGEDDNGTARPSVAEFKEDWGELNVGTSCPQIFVLDLACPHKAPVQLEVQLPDLEGGGQGVSFGSLAFSPDGSHLLAVAIPPQSRRLGLVYCSNRSFHLYAIPLSFTDAKVDADADAPQKSTSVTPVRIGESHFRVEAPMFTPRGDRLLFLTRVFERSHRSAAQVRSLPWPLPGEQGGLEGEVVLDVVEEYDLSDEESTVFAGFFADSLSPAGTKSQSPWVDDSHLVLSIHVRSTVRVAVVDVYTDTSPTFLDLPAGVAGTRGTFSLLDAREGRILAKWSSYAIPSRVFVGNWDGSSVESWTPLEEEGSVLDIETSVSLVSCTDGSGDVFEMVLITPGPSMGGAGGVEGTERLIVNPHGGPHSCYTDGYDPTTAFYVMSGYAVAKPNYRGSTGFGMAFVRSLSGSVGTKDVADVEAAREAALAVLPSVKETFLVGGSHGGFLSSHCGIRFPEAYTAVAVRNPVTNMSSSMMASDIPDWLWDVNGRGVWGEEDVSGEMVAALFEASPVAHLAQGMIPFMIQIGLDDLRVPPQQGRELFYGLKAKGGVVRLLEYSDNSHPLSKPMASVDREIHALRFFSQVASTANH